MKFLYCFLYFDLESKVIALRAGNCTLFFHYVRSTSLINIALMLQYIVVVRRNYQEEKFSNLFRKVEGKFFEIYTTDL